MSAVMNSVKAGGLEILLSIGRMLAGGCEPPSYTTVQTGYSEVSAPRIGRFGNPRSKITGDSEVPAPRIGRFGNLRSTQSGSLSVHSAFSA